MTGPASRTVVVIRHAHAGDSAAAGGPKDHERELDGRGRREATAAGAWLADQGLTLDVVLVSDAARTRQTWSSVAAQLADPPEPTIEARIYNCDLDELMNLLGEDRAQVPVVAVVGHNPAVSELVWFLAGHDGPVLVPGAVAVIQVAANDGGGLSPGHVIGGFSPSR